MVEKVGIALVVHHGGMDGKALLGHAGQCALVSPSAVYLLGGSVVYHLAALSHGSVNQIVEVSMLVEPRTFHVVRQVKYLDGAVQ